MAKGKEYWWYWCVGPEQPEFLNTFIERPGIEARMLPWLAALRNVNGEALSLLYLSIHRHVADMFLCFRADVLPAEFVGVAVR